MKKLNYKLTLFVGDTGEYLSVEASTYNSNAFLLDRNNVNEFINSELNSDTTVYTSLGDLKPEVLYNVLLLADKIVYAPPETWSDGKIIDLLNPSNSSQGFTEMLLLNLSCDKVIENIEKAYFFPTVIPLTDTRKSEESQLWFAGCSVTHGVGVSTHERYGELLSKTLKFPASFLTRPGSSIPWAADQILRADIRANDIVVWGITESHRITVIGDGQLLPGVNVASFENKIVSKYVSIDALFSETTFYENIYAIERVINFCNKIGAKLFLFGLYVSNNALRFLKTKENFYYKPRNLKFKNNSTFFNFIDLGSDNSHPGPLQHQQYADICQASLKKLQYI